MKNLNYLALISPWLAMTAHAVQTNETQQPNILLIMVDQLIADGMSCMDNHYVKTPALDKIADNGVLFTNSYVTQPLSSPCRTSLHTGLYPHENGVIRNGDKLTCKPSFMASQLLEAGYNTAHFGKWHVPCELIDAGYEEGTTTLKDGANTQLAIEYLKGNNDSKPYFLTVSYNNPHNVCELARGEKLPNGKIDSPPKEIDLLPPLPPNFEIPPKEPNRIREVQKANKGQYPTADWDEQDWREYLWGYYRLIEKVDAEIGEVLDLAIESTNRELIVLFVSDHGEGVARHHWNQKQILYDQSVKVPTLIASFSGNSIKLKGSCNTLVSMSIDIPATILEIGSAKRVEQYSGTSLWDYITKEGGKPNRKYIYSETVFGSQRREAGLRGRMVRSDRYKYCIYDNGEWIEQLFDMKKDPGEIVNLAYDKRHAKVLSEMRGALKEWSIESKDSYFLETILPQINDSSK